MATVNIKPMPATYRSIPEKFRPCHPPVFPDGKPSAEDVELARELFRELDEESKAWYGRTGIFSDL